MVNFSSGQVFMMLGMFIFALQDAWFKFLTGTGMSLFQIYSIRSFFGIIFLFIFLKIIQKRITFFTTHHPILSLLRVFCWFMAYSTFFVGLSIMSLADAVTLFFVSPMFIFIFSKILNKSLISFKSWVALVFGFLGVYILMGVNFKEINLIYFLPLFAAFFYALSMVITKITSQKDDLFQQLMHFQLGGFLFGGILSIIFYFVGLNDYNNRGLTFFMGPWSMDIDKEIFYIVILSILNLSASVSVIYAYRISDPPNVAIFEYNYLFWSILLSLIFWRDIPTYSNLIGLVFIVSSGIFITFRQKNLNIEKAFSKKR